MRDIVLINDFARRSFRDVADQDYIAARVSYRAELAEPFLWCSQQALEKYLKAILLFNKRSAKRIRHDLEKALSRVNEITDIGFDLPEDIIRFVKYVNQFGANRYLEYSTYLRPKCLIELDRTVWYIRRYCYYMRGNIKRRDGTCIPRLPFEVSKVHNKQYEKNPHTYRILGGYLENVIEKESEAFTQLTWKNFYYGRRKKKRIKKYSYYSSSVNPTLTLHPEGYEVLQQLVDFSKETRQLFKSK